MPAKILHFFLSWRSVKDSQDMNSAAFSPDRRISVMGIVNLTDNSYFASSRCLGPSGEVDLGKALDRTEQMLAEARSVDMFHIVLNGNMTFDMMTAVYEACRGSAHRGSVMVIDGIHVSRQAELLWKRVVADSAVSLCVDIYRRGIVWFNPDLPHRCYTVAY